MNLRALVALSLSSAGGAADLGSIGAVPTTARQLEASVAELRRHYAPFLESRPAPTSSRQRQDLCGDDWLSRYEKKRVSDMFVAALAPRPQSPGWEKVDCDDSGWRLTTVPEWRYDELERKYH